MAIVTGFESCDDRACADIFCDDRHTPVLINTGSVKGALQQIRLGLGNRQWEMQPFFGVGSASFRPLLAADASI